ncbi:MAG: hypothetical protein AB2766_00085 [Candidatus Thiodiazotropha endolucinida]
MSAPSHRTKQAEQISYGLLAINAIEAINALLNNDELTSSDTDALKRAEEFLLDIADGEELITKATFHGRNSKASLKALDIVIGEPLKELKKIAQDEKKFAENLRILAGILSKAIEHSKAVDDNEKTALKVLTTFFELLDESLMSVMTRSRQRLNLTKQNKASYHKPAMGI